MKERCTAGQLCATDGTCSNATDCGGTSGSAYNSAPCKCSATSYCTAANYCLAASNYCPAKEMCGVTDGSAANTDACQCTISGSECTAGQLCNAGTCTDVPTPSPPPDCSNTDGNANRVECVCNGGDTCAAHQICTAATSPATGGSCSNPTADCTNNDGVTQNTGTTGSSCLCEGNPCTETNFCDEDTPTVCPEAPKCTLDAVNTLTHACYCDGITTSTCQIGFKCNTGGACVDPTPNCNTDTANRTECICDGGATCTPHQICSVGATPGRGRAPTPRRLARTTMA
jgi:hypothetical protein